MESDLFSLPHFAFKTNAVLQMAVTNPIKRILPGKFYGSPWEGVKQYFFLIPEEYLSLCLHLLVYCGIYFEGKTSLLVVK